MASIAAPEESAPAVRRNVAQAKSQNPLPGCASSPPPQAWSPAEKWHCGGEAAEAGDDFLVASGVVGEAGKFGAFLGQGGKQG